MTEPRYDCPMCCSTSFGQPICFDPVTIPGGNGKKLPCLLCRGSRQANQTLAGAFRLDGLRAAQQLDPAVSDQIDIFASLMIQANPHDWCSNCGASMEPGNPTHSACQRAKHLGDTPVGDFAVKWINDAYKASKEGSGWKGTP